MRVKISNLYTTILAVVLISLIISCKKDKEKDPDPTLAFKSKIVGTWKVSAVTLSGNDVMVYYKDLTVTFAMDNTYACDHAMDPVWPVSGTFEVQIENDQVFILRSDLVKMTAALDANQLRLQFTWSGKAPSGGRVESVAGDYDFTFIK